MLEMEGTQGPPGEPQAAPPHPHCPSGFSWLILKAQETLQSPCHRGFPNMYSACFTSFFFCSSVEKACSPTAPSSRMCMFQGSGGLSFLNLNFCHNYLHAQKHWVSDPFGTRCFIGPTWRHRKHDSGHRLLRTYYLAQSGISPLHRTAIGINPIGGPSDWSSQKPAVKAWLSLFYR